MLLINSTPKNHTAHVQQATQYLPTLECEIPQPDCTTIPHNIAWATDASPLVRHVKAQHHLLAPSSKVYKNLYFRDGSFN